MNCAICGVELDNPNDPTTENCGGDCLYCMYEAGDPDATMSYIKILENQKSKFKKDFIAQSELISLYDSFLTENGLEEAFEEYIKEA